MKFYKAVVERLEETNYKKGVVRLDTKSGYYTASRTLYYIAFAWFMIFQASYLFANTIALLYYKKAAENVHTELYICFWVATALLIAGFIFVKLKYHIAAVVSNTVACIAQMIQLYRNEDVSLGFLNHGVLSNKYFWFHFAPAILIILFTVVLGIIGVKTYIHFRNDYKATLASMFADFSQQNPNISDIEWQEHLEKLDDDKKISKNIKNKKK